MRKFKSFIKDGLIEQPRQKGTTKDHLVQPLVGEGAWMKLLSTLSNHVLKSPSNGDSTALTVKKFFLMLRCKHSWCNSHPLPIVFSTWLLVKRDTSFPLWMPLKHREHCAEIPSERRDPDPSVFPCRTGSPDL